MTEKQSQLAYAILAMVESLAKAKGQDAVDDNIIRDTVGIVGTYQSAISAASLAAFDARKGIPAIEAMCRISVEHGYRDAGIYMAVRQAIDSYIYAPLAEMGD